MFSSGSIAVRSSGRYRLIPWMLGASAICLIAGLVMPVMEVDRFFLFTDRFSIIDSLFQLFDAEEYFLLLVISVFTLVFPAVKLCYAAFLWGFVDIDRPGFDRRLHVIELLGKWSMLDVLLLAIAAASLKMSIVGAAHANPGLYFFSAAIVLAMLGAQWLKSAVRDVQLDEGVNSATSTEKV